MPPFKSGVSTCISSFSDRAKNALSPSPAQTETASNLFPSKNGTTANISFILLKNFSASAILSVKMRFLSFCGADAAETFSKRFKRLLKLCDLNSSNAFSLKILSAFVSAKSYPRDLKTVALSAKKSISVLFVASTVWLMKSPSLHFCSDDILSDWGVIFLKYPLCDIKKVH